MAKTVFDRILDTTTGPKSFDYYKKRVQEITSPGARALINRGKATIRPKYGVMNLFGYDPKLKQVLPLYDRFPLIFPIEPAKGGFYGINFHYLQPGARVAFLRQLQRFATDKNYDKNTRYNIGELSGRYFKKTIKRYLFSQVRTSFLNITADEMAIAIFLPVARFEKGQPY
mgnify:FL=1